MMYFKVKTGYGVDDFISIDETEVRSAINAQVTGKVAVCKGGTISGNHIISITPDYNRLMGYHRDYQLNGEDYDAIGNTEQVAHQNFLEDTRNELTGIKAPERTKEISDGVKKLAESKRV